jgi:hypothetical protein
MVELFLQYDHWDEKSKINDQTEKIYVNIGVEMNQIGS